MAEDIEPPNAKVGGDPYVVKLCIKCRRSTKHLKQHKNKQKQASGEKSVKNNTTVAKDQDSVSNVTPTNLSIKKQKSREELEKQLDGIVQQFKNFEEELKQQRANRHRYTEVAGMTQTTSTALDAYTHNDPIVISAMDKNTHMSTDRLRASSV